jgi:hypothetical protein
VFYAKVTGPRGINQSLEFHEPLEVWGWGSGRRGEPKYPKLCTNHDYGSDKNDDILTRFISQLVRDGWEFAHTVSDQQPLFAVLTRQVER